MAGSNERGRAFELIVRRELRVQQRLEGGNRLHTVSSRIESNGEVFMTEKEDPICRNLEEVIIIEKIAK